MPYELRKIEHFCPLGHERFDATVVVAELGRCWHLDSTETVVEVDRITFCPWCGERLPCDEDGGSEDPTNRGAEH